MSVEASFGEWLRRSRRALNLSQNDLARKVGCSEVTIRKMEADERRPGTEVAERLAASLAIPAEERMAFLRFARGEYAAQPPVVPVPEAPSMREATPPVSSLPVPLTSLIGREREVAIAATLLSRDDVRLLTLTGPGGIGKTRLSIAVATELQDKFADGVVFVALAPISDAALVASSIAHVLGLKEGPGEPLVAILKKAVGSKHLLLVLDNFEQVLDAAPLVAELLQTAPRLKVLVTSRATLHLSGEQEYVVPPLARPSVQTLPTLESLDQYPAINLFVQRTRLCDPQFTLTSANAAAVAEICHRLDGLPLAIELAAARTRLLSPVAMLGRLSSRLTLLVGGARDLPARHQTLRNTIAWSYDLLQAEEQTLLARLSVFVNGCTLEAVEVVASDQEERLDVLAIGAPMAARPRPQPLVSAIDDLQSLLDKSLVWQAKNPDGEIRFGMLETIREFAALQLAAHGEEATLRQRHADYYLAQAQNAQNHLAGPDQGAWLLRLEQEHDNLRAALDWCETDEPGVETGLLLAGALGKFWELRGYHGEGRQRIGRLLALPAASGYRRACANAGNVAGRLAWYQGDLQAARMSYSQSLALFRLLGDKQGEALALNNLGNIVYDQGDLEAARLLHEQSLAIRRALHDQRGIAASLNNLGNIAVDQGDYETAYALHDQGLALRRQVGDKIEIAGSLCNLGEIRRSQGATEQAAQLFREGLAMCRDLGHRWGIAFISANLGMVTLYQGKQERARTLFEESLELFQELQTKQGIAIALDGLGRVAHAQGNYAEANARYSESLRLFQELGEQRKVANALEQFAALLWQRGQVEVSPGGWDEQDVDNLAGQLAGAAAALRATIGVPQAPVDRPHFETTVAGLRQKLGEQAFRQAWDEGAAMTTDQVITQVLTFL